MISVYSSYYFYKNLHPEDAPHLQDALGQVLAVVGGGGVQAVDDHAVAAVIAGGVDESFLPQVHGHVALEEDQVPPVQPGAGDGLHGEGGVDAGVTVDEDAVHQVGLAAQAGTVDAQGGAAPPAVLDAHVGERGFHQPIPKLDLVGGVPGGDDLPQEAVLGIPFTAVAEGDRHPSVFIGGAGGADPGATGEGLDTGPLDLGGVQNIGGETGHHLLGQGLPPARTVLC